MYKNLPQILVGVACCLLVVVSGYRMYQDNIPNGEIVPHPCKPNYIWRGVGHQNVLGGGARNPFGVAFAAANYEWTTSLCQADSDGDGSTNGAELGDPNCVWTKGSQPERSIGLSHPGVCEPIDSAECIAANAWEIDCSGLDYTCPGIGDAATVNLTLTFDQTAVPARETTYMCQVFDIPSDRPYHLFGTKPEIDNLDVMHHMILYGCEDGVEGFDTPTECGMATSQCYTMLGAWTVGYAGECHAENTGFLVGGGAFTKVLIEHHWNNPTRSANYVDASGMTLFLTPNLRQYNLGFLMTGQEEIEIPPGEDDVAVYGSCSGERTEYEFWGDISIVTAHLHMHYLGSAGKIEHYRDGNLVNTLFDESTYNYDLPVFNHFSTPVQFLRGDEIKTTCHFKSTSRSDYTYYGEGTSDEMCYGFLVYYPKENGIDECVGKASTPSVLFAGVISLFTTVMSYCLFG